MPRGAIPSNAGGYPSVIFRGMVVIEVAEVCSGAKDKEAAQAAAVRQWEEEKGGVADSVEAEEEPDGR
jgi:hypothetical protein